MRRLAGVLAVTLVIILGACSDDGEDDTAPSTTVPRQSVITGAIDPPSVTVGPVEPGTTTPVVTQPVLPTTPASTPARTEPPADIPCDATVLFGVIEAAAGALPPGTGTQAPVCEGGWAAMVIGAPDQERALAVFMGGPAGWSFVTLGNDAVCTDAGVPAELFGALGCALWETS